MPGLNQLKVLSDGKKSWGRPVSGLYIDICCSYFAQIPIMGKGQVKLLFSKPSGSQVDPNINEFISVALWNENCPVLEATGNIDG